MTLKMFVWEDVLTDYTSGMVCVLANNEVQAYELLYAKDDIAWSELMGLWDVISWGHPEIKKLSAVAKDGNKNLCELQHTWMKQNKIKLFDGRIKPVVVTKPTAFTVHGGG